MPIVPPQGDCEDAAKLGDRLILQHGTASQPESRMVIAPKGVLTSGWLLGIFEPENWH